MENIISIFLVEDHVIVRNALKDLIEKLGNYKVTGEYDNGEELVQNIHTGKVDIIVLDLDMPVMNGEETMRWMKKNNISIPVLVLTFDKSDATIISLYKLGVRGYLSKTCSGPTLKKAIDDIIETGYYHNELLSNALRRDLANPRIDEKSLILKQLSERELEFLLLVCNKEEYTYEQISGIMKVSRRTIEGYRESVFDKFNIKSKTGLVLFAIKYGLVTV